MRLQPRILVVEDEASIAELIAVNLRHNGYQITWATDGKSAQRELDDSLPDLILLDWMLPGESGLLLAKRWRADPRTKAVPIIILTARGDENDRVAGLDVGADDYITKPFSMEELLARIEAILRRTSKATDGKSEKGTFALGNFVFDYNHQNLNLNGVDQKLTSKEAELLKILCEHVNQVVDRSFALNRIWQNDSYFNARSMDVYIAKIRKYLKEDTSVELINVHGIGFKLVTEQTS